MGVEVGDGVWIRVRRSRSSRSVVVNAWMDEALELRF